MSEVGVRPKEKARILNDQLDHLSFGKTKSSFSHAHTLFGLMNERGERGDVLFSYVQMYNHVLIRKSVCTVEAALAEGLAEIRVYDSRFDTVEESEQHGDFADF